MTTTLLALLASLLLAACDAQAALRGALNMPRVLQGHVKVNETAVSKVAAITLPDAVLLDDALLQDNSTGVKSDIDLDKLRNLAMMYKASYYPWHGSPVVYHPSGHVVVYHPSGHVVVHHPSGHIVVHHPSGHVVVHHPSGHTIVYHPSGHRVVYHPWGGVTVHPPIFATANVSLRVPQLQGDAKVQEIAISKASAITLPDAALLDDALLKDNSTDVKSDIDLDKLKNLAMMYKASYYPWHGSPVVYHPSGHAVVYHPSGHVVVHHPSGHIVVHHPSGHVVVHHPSGHTVVYHPSGHRVVYHPWGGVTVHPPIFAAANVSLRVPQVQGDAKVKETAVSKEAAIALPDESALLEDALLQDNSTGVKSDIDLDKLRNLAMMYKSSYFPWYGSPVVYHPSGHAVVYHPSGHVVVHHPSGHIVVHHPSGHVVVHHPSGHTVVHHPSGHRIVYHPWGGVTVHPPMWR